MARPPIALQVRRDVDVTGNVPTSAEETGTLVDEGGVVGTTQAPLQEGGLRLRDWLRLLSRVCHGWKRLSMTQASEITGVPSVPIVWAVGLSAQQARHHV